MISVIEKEIQKSDIASNPSNDGKGDPPAGAGAHRGAPQGPVQAGAASQVEEGKVAVRATAETRLEHLKEAQEGLPESPEDEQELGETELQKTTDNQSRAGQDRRRQRKRDHERRTSLLGLTLTEALAEIRAEGCPSRASCAFSRRCHPEGTERVVRVRRGELLTRPLPDRVAS